MGHAEADVQLWVRKGDSCSESHGLDILCPVSSVKPWKVHEVAKETRLRKGAAYNSPEALGQVKGCFRLQETENVTTHWLKQ